VFSTFNTHLKPVSSIIFTPSQNVKKRVLGVQLADGNCAKGNLKPLSPMYTNCRTWEASWTSLLCPENVKNSYLKLACEHI